MLTVAEFAIALTRYLDPSGEAIGPLPPFAQQPDELVVLYRAMVLTRTFDAKAIALQRTGRLGTYASSLGQEAVSVGTAAAMRSGRCAATELSRTRRAALARRQPEGAVPVLGWRRTRQRFRGAAPGFSQLRPGRFPRSARGGRGAGVSAAGEQRAAVCVFGDGATSKGDVAEALNMAGVWKVPVVFVVNNNGWAISVPVAKQTAAATLAQKAIAAGIPGEQVDGNDVIAVRAVVSRAIERADRGDGPTLDRGRDLSPLRPHDRRRCEPLSQRCRGQSSLARRACRTPAQLHDAQRPVGQEQGRRAAARMQCRGRTSRGGLPGDCAAIGGNDL